MKYNDSVLFQLELPLGKVSPNTQRDKVYGKTFSQNCLKRRLKNRHPPLDKNHLGITMDLMAGYYVLKGQVHTIELNNGA